MLLEITTQPKHTSRDLVDLLEECHARIRRFVNLAHEAALRDAPHDEIERACADVERYFTEALPLHVADEEISIAPRLRGLSPEVDRALDVMTSQHREHSPVLVELLRASATVRVHPTHQGASDDLAKVARELKIEFEEHLTLEERVIFPAIRKLVPPEDQAEILAELRKRRQSGMLQESWSMRQILEEES